MCKVAVYVSAAIIARESQKRVNYFARRGKKEMRSWCGVNSVWSSHVLILINNDRGCAYLAGFAQDANRRNCIRYMNYLAEAYIFSGHNIFNEFGNAIV